MIYPVLHILFLLLFIYLAINICYLFFLSIAGRFSKNILFSYPAEKKKIAVLVTSFKEDEVIVNTVMSAAEHDYPNENFDVFLAADQLQPTTINRLKQLNAEVHEVQFTTGSKARSLNWLLNIIDEDKYAVALILDGDNIMLPGFIEKINNAFIKGARAVQGHRVAKNLNTSVAVLDALSEEVNNHLFRRAQKALGFSASLSGSGMAFDFKKLKDVYNKPGILDNPACDREVDFEMMKADIKVEYLDDACILDEKVSTGNVYENQRRRWLESQIIHLKLFFTPGENIQHKTKDYWNKLFINLIPPRIFFLVIFFLVFCTCIIGILLSRNITGINYCLWAILFLLYVLSIIFSIPRRFQNRKTIKAFLHVPVILFYFIKAALTMRSNRKEFIHTPKSYSETAGDSKK
jgi:cellulose synthase/poly-beta-1,6-N-acetylglucosamine synthase-like glycosyltransferase